MKRRALLILLLALLPLRLPAGESLTADEVMRRAEAAFAALSDYECLSDSETRLGAKVESGTHRIWFKQPRMLRVHVLRGRDDGSEVAVGADGRVRGHKGGILKAIVIRLSANDKRLRNLRGVPVTDLPWGRFYEKYRERAARPGARTALQPRLQPDDPYDLVLTYADGGKAIREVYRIEARRWVMMQGDVYENEVRVHHIVFRDIRLNTGVKDSWFKL
jgi:outer membrane lipoprotein-sorting protein